VGSVIDSTLAWFNVTNLTYFNWTTSNITIGAINDSIQVFVDNKTTFLAPNYSQVSDDIASAYADVWEQLCFPQWVQGNNNYNLSFFAQNASGVYTNTTGNLSAGNTTNIILSIHTVCPPGKYYGYFRVYRSNNTEDNATVYATVDIPITADNTLNSTYYNASFRGTIAINDSYHSFYFNATELTENVTYLTIVLTGLSDDVDIFLFDNSGSLQGKSIEKSTSEESIMDISLPTSSAMWEIRVYGNVSSDYRGYLYYSNLNITNTTYSNETISSLDFGDLNPNTTYPTTSKNYTLKNEDDRVLPDVNEYSEIYHVDTWTLKNTSRDFTDFLVPNFTQKIKVKINWTDEDGKNITDWNLYLTDPSGTLINSSTSKFINSNKTNATREEFIVYNGPFTDKEGFWNISVRNVTNSTIPMSYYDLTAYIWFNLSSWISTNYQANHDFNSTANNATYNVSLNLTIPEREVLDGKYEGYLKYNNTGGWITRLPISFNVSVGTLIINASFRNNTIRLTDNIGFNRTGSNALTLNITYNNTGSYPIYYTNTSSNSTLTKDSNSNISFSVDWPSSKIPAFSGGVINISFDVNVNLTGNDAGIYKGWIFFNTTNTTLNSSSYPYETFNLSLEVNLTNLLDVRVLEIRTADSNNWIENTTRAENITLVTAIYLINGSQLGDTNDNNYVQTLYVENFTSASIQEYSVQSETSTLTGRSQLDPSSTDLLCSGALKCYVNYTVAANRKGGRYNVSLTVTWNTGLATLTGTGKSNDTLMIKDTGLYLTRLYPPLDDFDISEGGNITYFNASVVNYGPINPTGGTITFANVSDCPVTISPRTADSNCSSSSSGNSFTQITVPGNASSACVYVWRITSGDVSATEDCDYTISTSNTSYGSLSGTLYVTNITPPVTTTTVPSSSGSTSGGGDGSDTTSQVSGTTNYIGIIDYPTSVSIEQGGSKKLGVTVNNTNKTLTQNVILDVKDINSSWYSVNPSTSVKLKRAESYTFEVTFSVPSNATVGDYSGKFNATSFYQYKTVIKIYDTVLKDFTLKVTPGEALKSEIASTLSSYTNEINDLEQQINQSKDQGYNTSEVESLLSQLKTKIDQANGYVNTGNYISAYNLLDDISSLINQTENTLTGLPITGRVGGILEDWWSWGKWVIIVVAVVVVAVLGYMLWPTKLGEPKPAPGAVVQRTVEEKKDKITETFMKLKERWKKVKEKEEAEKRGP